MQSPTTNIIKGKLYDELLEYLDEPVDKTIERFRIQSNWHKTDNNTCTLRKKFMCSCNNRKHKDYSINQNNYRLIGTEIYLCE